MSSVLRLCSDRIAIAIPGSSRIGCSELGRFLDRHQLGILDRDHLGTMIFISSE